MPSINHFTQAVDASEIPLSIEVNCYATNTIRSLHLNCPMSEMCSGPTRLLREGRQEQGGREFFKGCSRPSLLLSAAPKQERVIK